MSGSVSRGASSGIDAVVDLGVAADVAVSEGDTERVDGALTTTESFVVLVDREDCEPVRKRDAARRGRAGDEDELEDVRLIRAASWLSDGGLKLAGVRSGPGLGAWIEACSDWLDGGLDMVDDDDDDGGGRGVVDWWSAELVLTSTYQNTSN